MTPLLDANMLIPLCIPGHVHYPAAAKWILENPAFAVCPLTEGALVRYLLRTSPQGQRLARETLELLKEYEGYEFWPADITYPHAFLNRISGPQQVTDAYLVALAAHHGGRLATLDKALVRVHPEAVLVPMI